MKSESWKHVCIVAVVLLSGIARGAEPSSYECATVRPVDNRAELRNPGMGFCLYYYTNFLSAYGARLAPSDLLRDWPGLTTVYMRIPWSLVEPKEGQFDWSILDTPMQRFAEGGLKAAFRFTCSENFGEAQYAAPKWVMQAGAKGYYHGNPELKGNPETAWEPDFGDPIFLAKLEGFLKVLAARYDGHPDVAFVDIGSFGVWGEGHTWGSTGRCYPSETIRRHLALYAKYFRKTPVVGNIGFLERPGTKPPWKKGLLTMKFVGVIPVSWRGKSYSLHVGMHDRGVNECFADIAGRLLPWKGDSHRSVPIGELHIADDGTPALKVNPGTLTQNAKDFAAGARYAAEAVKLEYDPVRRPNSCKVVVRLFLPELLMQGPFGPSSFIAIREKGMDSEIVAMHAETNDDVLTGYMVENNIALRDDSVNGREVQSYFDSEVAQKFWPRVPIILETFHYGMMIDWKTWNRGSAVLQAVEDDHASYLSVHYWPDVFLKENRDLVRKINLRLGYRFLPVEVSWRKEVPMDNKLIFKWMKGVPEDDRFVVNWTWRNAGVAPCHLPVYPAIALKDKTGGIVGVFVDEKVRLDSLMPGKNGEGKPLTASRAFALPPLSQAGEYDVYISAGDRLGKPLIALPLDGSDGHLRYRIGACRIKNKS